MREVWWDIRPHPNFGTIELRICDGLPTLREVSAIAALAQCLVSHLDTLDDRGYTLPRYRDWVLRQNKWRAGRHGLDTDLIVDENGRLEPAREAIHTLVQELTPVAQRLGCLAELAGIEEIMDVGPSYVRQRRAAPDEISAPADLRPVVQQLVRELDTDELTR